MRRTKGLVYFAVFGVLLSALTPNHLLGADASASKWWKGVTHIHSTWSDGTSYPEVVAEWYKKNGYNFIVVTDHQVIQAGEKWKKVESKSADDSLAAYRSAFGDKWVELKEEGSKHIVRCRPLSEYRDKTEKAGEFIIVRGEEITCKNDKRNAHVVAINLAECIEPKVGSTVVATFENSIKSVYEQGERLKVKTLPILCHPNWGNGPSVEEMWQSDKVKHFEIVNGLPYNEWNAGNHELLSMDKFWDVALAKRIESGSQTPLYGIAADDMHRLSVEGGYSWIMVKTDTLAAEKLVAAMERGEFYSSTGVVLKDVGLRDGKLCVEVQPEKDVSYTIQFIGTLRNYDKSGEEGKDSQGKLLPPTRRYSSDIGKVLQETKGVQASYTFTGNELCVRAKVVSSKMVTGEKGMKVAQCAWSQPVTWKKSESRSQNPE